MLRNPSNEKQIFTIDVTKVFETSDNKNREYKFYDVRTKKKSQPVTQRKTFQIELEPFEVKVLDAVPVN